MNDIQNVSKQHPDKTAKCTRCSCDFTYTPFTWFSGEIIEQEVCDLCEEVLMAESAAIKDAKARAETMANRRELWEDVCPPRFLLTDKAHPEFKQQLHAKVMQWSPTPPKPWLGLVGKRGCCKTRIALLRLEQVIMHKEGPFSKKSTSPLFITAYEFVEAVQSRFGTSHEKVSEILTDCMTARWLVFDDISKARATPAVVAALFAMIDHRHAHNLTTIWTSNSTPEEFCEGMPPDVAGPLVRRLKESSTLYSIA